jgi:DNA polymerase-3 subunit gamma/tau
MQLASITFDGEKKNNKHYIIPPSYFEAKGHKTPVLVQRTKRRPLKPKDLKDQ